MIAEPLVTAFIAQCICAARFVLGVVSEFTPKSFIKVGGHVVIVRVIISPDTSQFIFWLIFSHYSL